MSSKGTRISDAELDREILAWANARVAGAGAQRRIASFHDPGLASGLFLVRVSGVSGFHHSGFNNPILLRGVRAAPVEEVPALQALLVMSCAG